MYAHCKWYWHSEALVSTISHVLISAVIQLVLKCLWSSLFFLFLFFSFFFFKEGYYYTLREDALQILSDCECSVRGLKLKALFLSTNVMVLCSGQYYATDSDTTILTDCESSQAEKIRC